MRLGENNFVKEKTTLKDELVEAALGDPYTGGYLRVYTLQREGRQKVYENFLVNEILCNPS